MEIIRYVLLANTLLVVVSVAYYVLLRQETFFNLNRLVLWLSVAGALLLPLLELPDWRPQPVRSVMHRTAQVIMPRVLPKLLPIQPEVTITFSNQKTYRAFRDQQSALIWSWSLGLWGLYALGVLLLLIRFSTQLLVLQRLIRRSIHELYDDFILVQNETVRSPFSFFDWVVLNPNQHTSVELEQVLRHERVHVREYHSLDMIGAELICIIFWFNPAVYLFRHLLRQTLEFSADQAVVAEGVDAKAYQYHLVKVSLATEPLALTNRFTGQHLRQRIRMMNQQRSKPVVRLRCLFLLLLLFVVTLGCQLGSSQISHRYIQSKGNVLLGIITARTSDQDLDTLRQELAHRDIDLTITKLIRTVNGSIHQLGLQMQIPRPGHPIDVTIGSSIGQSLIQPFGLRCDVAGCQFVPVDEQFPERLVTLAKNEAPILSTEGQSVSYSDKNANAAFGLYQVFFRNDFLESCYFGLRNTAVRLTPDFHLDLYPEFEQAVVYLDGHEITRQELLTFPVLDLKKVVVFTGEAAVLRLGDVRAKHGLILLSRLQNISVRDKYTATNLLERAYPTLFVRP